MFFFFFSQLISKALDLLSTVWLNLNFVIVCIQTGSVRNEWKFAAAKLTVLAL